MRDADVSRVQAIVHNLRSEGCRIELSQTFETETPLWITFPDIGKVPARVTGRSGRLHTCRFVIPLSKAPGNAAAVAVVELRENDAAEADRPAAVRPWPRPVRVSIAILLALGLWALILAWFGP